MQKRKLISSIILSIVAILILVIAFSLLGKEKRAKEQGEIKIEVIALDYSLIKAKTISFDKDDTLRSLIQDNFMRVVFEETEFGPFLKSIEGYRTPSDFSTYIAIYINGEYSTVGIGSVELKDGMQILLIIEEA